MLLVRPGGAAQYGAVLQFWRMSKTLTIRLTDEQAAWLAQAARRTGLPQGRIIRDQIELARTSGSLPSFMRLAGAIDGPDDLSMRKGFSRK